MQLTVEACQSICINDLQKPIRETITKEDLVFTEEDNIHDFYLKELRKITVNGQNFDFEAKKNYLGGYRWFFLCPKCERHANKLFLPPISAGSREQKYLCKTCHKLKNQSALVGSSSLYKAVMKPLKRLKDIEDRIARGHLKADKVQALLDEHELIESQLKKSPDYRLFAFKRKHNLD